MNREIVGSFFLLGILAAAWATIASTPCKTQPPPQKDYTSALSISASRITKAKH